MSQREDSSWSVRTLGAAMAAVKAGMSVRHASKSFSIPRTTLRDHVTQRVRNASGLPPSPKRKGRKPVFPVTYEKELEQHILKMSQIFYGITRSELKRLAFDLAEHMDLSHPFDKASRMAGGDWVRRFMARHPNITLRAPEATSISRLGAFRRSEVNRFFENLTSLVEKNKYPASKIYNVDETAVPTVLPPQKVLAQKGARQVGVVSSAERGQNTTVVCCCNAAGGFVPPQMIFARKRITESLKEGAPPGTVFEASDNGWSTQSTFVQWLKHFARETGTSVQNRTLLVLDNHASHISLEAIQICEEHGIDMLTIPPHTSHKLQPLDVAVYGPLKTWYREEVYTFMKRNPGQRVTLHQISKLFGKAYLRTASVEKAVSAFRATGIEPLNPDVFTEEDFVASSHVLADRVLEETVEDRNRESQDIGRDDGDAGMRREPAKRCDAETQEAGSGEKSSLQAEEVPCSDSGSSSGSPDLTKNETLVRIISKMLLDVCGEQASVGKAVTVVEKTDNRDVSDILVLPSPTPKEVKRRVRSQRSEVLTSSPLKRKLLEKESQEAKKTKKTASRGKGKKTERKKVDVEESRGDADVCVYCGEGVIGKGELWYQCIECLSWSHEACTSGMTSAGFKCDFC